MEFSKDYTPVVKASAGDYSAAALVGTHSVLLGWNMKESAKRNDLLGFAILRKGN